MLASSHVPQTGLGHYHGGVWQWLHAQILPICFCVSVCAFAVELFGPAEIPNSMLYAVPALTVAWMENPKRAIQFAIFNFVLWALAKFIIGGAELRAVNLLNGFLRIAFYASFGVILVRLKHLQNNLRALAEERAVALAREAARSLQLEREIMATEEREKKRIGQDLHDGLCQHLVGTALAASAVLEDVREGVAQKHDAHRVLELIEEAIVQTRNIAKGLYPIETRSNGLMQALEELAKKTEKMFGVECDFVCNLPVLVSCSSTAKNLYRIAQESISNTLRHGQATKIEILLEEAENGTISLCVRGNGRALPATLPDNGGMGLRIMADRAEAIGGRFFLRSGANEGTEAICVTPMQ